jgi:hypothetical protein
MISTQYNIHTTKGEGEQINYNLSEVIKEYYYYLMIAPPSWNIGVE